MKRMLIFAVSCLGIVAGAWGQRLPNTVVPESYDLTLEPNLGKATFSGDEIIHVNVLKPTATVTLNAAELEFQEASITSGGATRKAMLSLDAAKEQAALTVSEELPARSAGDPYPFYGDIERQAAWFLPEPIRAAEICGNPI